MGEEKRLVDLDAECGMCGKRLRECYTSDCPWGLTTKPVWIDMGKYADWFECPEDCHNCQLIELCPQVIGTGRGLVWMFDGSALNDDGDVIVCETRKTWDITRYYRDGTIKYAAVTSKWWRRFMPVHPACPGCGMIQNHHALECTWPLWAQRILDWIQRLPCFL